MRISDWSSVLCSSDLPRPPSRGSRASDGTVALDYRVKPGNDSGGLVTTARLPPSVTLGPRAEGPKQATERSPWITGSSPVMTAVGWSRQRWVRSAEHTSELQSLMRISYAVFCLKNKKKNNTNKN